MSMQRIRDYYSVPAKKGGFLNFTDTYGSVFKCQILSASDDKLRVRIVSDISFGKRLILHPTWNVQYL